MIMKYKNILWDWNGTLMDDVGIAVNAVNIMLKSRALPEITIEQYYDYIDIPIIRFYERCFDMANEDKDAIMSEYQRIYAELASHLPDNTDTYEAVKRLADMGARQFVVSSCETNTLNGWLIKYGIAGFFEEVSGADNIYAESKTSRAVRLMAEHGLDFRDTVFIGDMIHDLETARAIGVDCILVTYGHQSPVENKKTGCVTADSLNEIPSLLCE